MMFALGGALFGATVLLPQLLQTLMGYSAQDAGMVLSPGAFAIILLLPLIGKLVGKVDARYLICFGFAGAAVALFHMTGMSLDMDFNTAVKLRIYQMVFVAFLFVPIQTMSYQGIPRDKNNAISGMTNLARNLGGSIGISAVSALLSQRGQFHQTMLASHTGQFDPEFQTRVTGLAKTFQSLRYGHRGGDAGRLWTSVRSHAEPSGHARVHRRDFRVCDCLRLDGAHGVSDEARQVGRQCAGRSLEARKGCGGALSRRVNRRR